MKRHGQIIGVKPEQIAAYERILAQVWPGVVDHGTLWEKIG